MAAAKAMSENATKTASLENQEANQKKLIDVLERLKATQQKHYDEAEAKLKGEMEKIEAMIEARQRRQAQMAVPASPIAEPYVVADVAPVFEQGVAPMPPVDVWHDTTVVETPANIANPQPEFAPPQDMNSMLTSVIEEMNNRPNE